VNALRGWSADELFSASDGWEPDALLAELLARFPDGAAPPRALAGVRGARGCAGESGRDEGGRGALAPGGGLRVPLLALDHARLRFGGIVALDDVSLEVAEGSISGLIGPNGAGKPTPFNAITGLYRLDRGDVVFDGRSIRRTRPSRVIRI